MRKQTTCENPNCRRTFWSPVRKSFIIIAKKKTEKGETRVVKGASIDRTKAYERCEILKEEYATSKEYDTAEVEKQMTIKKTMCQRCMNMINNLKMRQVSARAKLRKRGRTREIPPDESAKLVRAVVNRKIVTDFRTRMQAEARQKKLAVLKAKREAEKKASKEATEKLADIEGKVVIEKKDK